ncbi:hypothetical protein [Pseudoxanthomonas winnipegensis]|uniref:hypothetical protein n=1 Tax=Pseudoxanthomonas winnipegensis TaxID=2480810 RepID=UPI0013EEF61F|nr:hypothetical protein [Pseudoxanthomonas winnipegensis]
MSATAIALRQVAWPDDGALHAAAGLRGHRAVSLRPSGQDALMECVLPMPG